MARIQLLALFPLVTAHFLITACGANSTGATTSSQVKTETTNNTPRNYTRSTKSFVNLGSAQAFNLFLFEDLDQPSADTEGAVAVGGNATLANYSIGDKLTHNSERYDLIVAGNLIFKSGAVSQGSALVGGQTSIGAVSFAGKLVHGTPSIDFKSTQNLASSESRRLGDLPTTSAPKFETWGQARGGMELIGDDKDLNIFLVQSEELSRAYSLSIHVPKSSRVIINISGTVASLKNMEIRLNETSRNKVLFNFLDCTQLHISGISVEGSILAPTARIDFPSGVVRGQIIARSLKGQGQINNNPIDGPTDTTPLPLPQPPTPPDVPEIPYN